MSLIEQALNKRKAAAASQPEKIVAPSKSPVESPTAKPSTAYTRRVFGNPVNTKKIDRDALRVAGLLAPDSESRQIEHQFRTMKRPLIKAAFEDSARRSVMVCSALPGDGKTFTSLNLALSLAMERDLSVILVDGDVAKPHISQILGAGKDMGLLDVLENPTQKIESVILPTDVPGLSVLPVGRHSHNATELLASTRMKDVITELEQLDPRCIVVVDSPPILLTSEARVLASLFGQIVMVVRAAGTPKQAVLDAIKLIGEGLKVSLVLNQAVHASDGDSYYGYGYKYGYGYGESPNNDSQT
jgi:protein-tyrosine kinase